ncbi:MAG TPA: DNA-formamidopyrimidine glycosylase family protein [Thermoleophilaceae bacterium]|jgi:endonuclease-8
MPEGDTIHGAARRLGEALVGREIVSIETPNPRHRHDRWPERLSGHAVRAVDAHGKHLFLRFDNDLTLHSHLRMGGRWSVYRRGERWTRSARRAWLVIRTADHEVVQFDGPVLELVTDSRTRFDQQLAGLGPDLLAGDFDESRFLARLREDDQTRPFGDALLDQRNVAGLGNIWRAEACFHARVDPHRPTADVSDHEALAAIRAVQPLMARSVAGAWPQPAVYKRSGRPCPRCGSLVASGGLGDDNRTAYWCPGCQT